MIGIGKTGERTFVLKKFFLEEPSQPGGLGAVLEVHGQSHGSQEVAVMG